MTARMKQQGLDRLADVLVEDILSTPGDQLLAEVAEDCGNARALADTFDKIVFRAKSSHDRLAAKASTIVTNQVLSGPLPKNESSPLAEQVRTLWQNVIPSVFDIIFPNRLVMIGICSACIASLAVIAAAPNFFDRVQEQNSGDRAGTQVFDGGPAGPRSGAPPREQQSEGTASERGVTRGLVPAPSSSSTAVPPRAEGNRPDGPQGGADSPKAIKPQDQFGQSTPSGPVTAAREPSGSKPGASTGGAATDNYLVQISSQRSKADAQASLRSLQAKFPKQLRDRKATIQRADLGPQGVYYRAVVGPFGSADDADRFCSSLQAAGGRCRVEKD
jgi:cell division septation protein DedD